MNTESPFISIQNGDRVPLERIPSMPAERLRLAILDALRSPSVRILAFFAVPDEARNEGHPNKLIAVLENSVSHSIEIASAPENLTYPHNFIAVFIRHRTPTANSIFDVRCL